MPNHLAGEASPYLRQHVDNAVDWYPWGEIALNKAKVENKPIFLSIGYSACHWCHVMAHESFENERIAAILNELFVSIKVDREERPDLDHIYMTAVQTMTGNGGWPMSVFLTPDGRPFYGGTYFPPEPWHGMPGFGDVLLAVADAWRNREADLTAGAQELVRAIEAQSKGPGSAQQQELEAATLSAAVDGLGRQFDWKNGGWGTAPKFPQAMILSFLLDYHQATSSDEALALATRSLDAMAAGGIYDQLGGGFHRYSVDSEWRVPHFEKMLYDNALLARAYLSAWQVTGRTIYRVIATETLDYVVSEMMGPEGGFYSAQDADSEGREGEFYLWSEAQIRQVLGEQAEAFVQAYGLAGSRSAEERSTLALTGELERRPELAEPRAKLLAARRHREPPGRDDKVLTSWNGLMLGAFAQAARVLGSGTYRRIAERSADFLLRELLREDGRLLHTWKDGQGRVAAYLDDYASLADGLVELYQATFEPRWYEAARRLVEEMDAHFGAPDGGFCDTGDDHEALICRPRDLQDNAAPSGSGMAAYVLLRMAVLAAEPRYLERARRMVAAMQPMLLQYPLAFGQWLKALTYATGRAYQVAIVGDVTDPSTQALVEVCTAQYRPSQVLAVGFGSSEAVPMLRDRAQVAGRATAYICVTGDSSACLAPVTDPQELRELVQEP
jgi:uncharacterized protein